MRQVGRAVAGIERLGRRRIGVLDVAGLACHRATFAGAFGQHRIDLVVRQIGQRAQIPVDLECVAALPGGPVAVGQHRHAVRDGDDLAHALDCLGGAVVELGNLGAGLRRARHHRHQHAGQVDVDAVFRRAVDLGRGVQALERLAQQLEVLAVLQRRVLRRGELGGCHGECAIAEFLPLRPEHLTERGAALRGLDLPLRGRSAHQHRARCGAGLAQGCPVRPHRGAAAGGLHAEHRVRVGLVDRRLLDAHRFPVGIELLGQQHRDGGVHALAHLGRAAQHGDAVVGRDAQPGVERGACRRGGAEAAAGRQHETEHQRAAGTHETAPVERDGAGGVAGFSRDVVRRLRFDRGVHAQAPFVS